MFVKEQLSSSSESRTTGQYAGLPATAIIEISPRTYLLAEFPIADGMWRHAVQYGVSGVVGDFGSYEVEDVDSFVRRDGLIHAGEKQLVLSSTADTPFIHLHCHSEYSPLDGLSRIDEMVDIVVQSGQNALAVTDHGMCAGHLELQKVATKAGVKPIFGVEANFIGNALDKSPETRGAYNHLILLAKNQKGLHNMWRASTMAHRPERFYTRSRMDWSLLEEFGEGMICSSACLRGPLSNMILAGDEDLAIQEIARFKGIFGEDFYLELHVNQLADQIEINKALVSLGETTSTPLIVVGDSHYPCREHADAHTVWIAAQTNKALQDEADLFSGHEEYHMHSAGDVTNALSYLDRGVVESAVAMTQTIADSCEASITGKGNTPVYHRHHQVDEEVQGKDLDAVILDRLCRAAMSERLPEEVSWNEDLRRTYEDRYQEEFEALVSKGFAGYMLINWDVVNYVREERILMGPGRGSAAGSLISYLLRITQVDPIEADLLFERFISPGRTELPDIDSDYPKSRRGDVTNYMVRRWGEEHVVRVGTVTRLRNKGVFKDVARVLKGSEHEVPYVDQEKISKLITEAEASTAGLGLPWDELWEQEGDGLSKWEAQYPELFKYAAILVGRLKSYGKHPAGVVIDPAEPIIDAIPLRQGEDEHPVTEFPMEVLDELGLVKFDVLTLRNLDTLQECMDLIERDGKYSIPHPHEWREQYKDPQVWDMLCQGDTLGVFQIETASGTRLTQRFQPRSVADLCAILTLVRPGPMRSGLTDSYLRRRDGQERVTYAHPLLEKVLHRTYGTMIYQEDIMATVKVIAGYDSAEADQVRKILGKKKVDKVAQEGQRFVSRAVEKGIDRRLAEHMFAQMEEFARYSFNKSHSWAYAMLAFWTAWFKCHFPVHFIVASLSTADKDRFPEFVMDARRKGYKIELPDVNESGNTFSVSSDGMGIRYGLSSIKGLGAAAAEGVLATRPYSDLMDFIDRRDAHKCNFGGVKLLASMGALDSLAPGHTRPEIEDFVAQISTGKLEQCAHLATGKTPTTPITECCDFDWGSEPVTIGKSGKPLKGKPIPKKCTKACRQYVAAPAVRWKDIPALSPKDVRVREREKIGLYVSSTPFDNLNMEGTASWDEIQHASEGDYQIVAEVRAVKKRVDRNNREMGFLRLLMEGGDIDVTVFSSLFGQVGKEFRPDALGLFSVTKNSRGLTLNEYIPFTTN